MTQKVPKVQTKTRRYRTIPAVEATGGGSAVCEPTASWDETFAIEDFLKIVYGLPFTDSFGIDDFLTVIYALPFQESFALDDALEFDVASSFADSAGAADGALGVALSLLDSLGADDRLAFVRALVAFADSIGLDDRLTVVDVASTFAETFGIAEAFVPDVSTTAQDSVEVADAVVADLAAIYAETFGLDDRLTLVDVASSTTDSFAFADLLVVDVSTTQPETFGLDDRLALIVALTTYVDSIGLDDRLTLASIGVVVLETFAAADALSVDAFVDAPETFGTGDGALGVVLALRETLPLWFDYRLAQGGDSQHQIAWSDAAQFSILGDIDVAVMVAYSDWTPAGFPAFASKWPSVAGDRSWILFFDGTGTGTPFWSWSTTGSNQLNAGATASLPSVGVADGSFVALRVTMDVNVGGANREINFWWKAMTLLEAARGGLLTPLSTWTQLGATVSQAGTTSIFNSNAAVHLGSQAQGQNPSPAKFVAAAIRNGIEGTLVLDWRAGDATGPYAAVAERANGASTLISPGIREPKSRYAPFLGLDDRLAVVARSIVAETAGAADGLPSASIANWTCGRSGTPDTDPCGDAWVDQANPTVNHGDEPGGG